MAHGDRMGVIRPNDHELPGLDARRRDVGRRSKYGDFLVRHRKWILLVFVLTCFAALVWSTRYQVGECDSYGCMVLDRWTGEVSYRPVGLP